MLLVAGGVPFQVQPGTHLPFLADGYYWSLDYQTEIRLSDRKRRGEVSYRIKYGLQVPE
ncbi:MAG: hypothetical protein F6K56_32695 [Moorea sp. SIO3G5]|nr:hypothetical protein [Moorena sp. SIO3G5]